MNDSPDTKILSRSQILIAMAVTALVLFGIASIWIHLFDVHPVRFTWQLPNFGVGIALGVLIVLLSGFIYQVWEGYRVAADSYLEIVLKPLNMVDLIWLGLLPGMSEEILFRGVAIPGLGMDVSAVVISSAIFGGLHLTSLKHWPYMFWAMLVGSMLGTVTLVTGDLMPAITAHVFTNSLSGMLWKLKWLKVAS